MKKTYSFISVIALTCVMAMMVSVKAMAQTKEQKTNIPTLYVDVAGNAAVTDKKVWKNATMTLVDGGNQTVASMKIRCRGNSTFTASKLKLAYRMKFDEPIALLGQCLRQDNAAQCPHIQCAGIIPRNAFLPRS